MLLSLTSWLQEHYPQSFGFLRVFQYHTFRAVMAAMTALLIGLFFGPWVIRRLTELKIGQPIREYGVQSHMVKRGTPTMGGVLVLIAIAIATLLWSDWSNRFVWIVMIVTFGFGAIGWSEVPVVGDVPGLGELFHSTNRVSQKRELVILLKPTIVQGNESWSQDMMDSQRRIQNLDPRLTTQQQGDFRE